MARPPKEGMDYFPHDTDASSDEKIEALRALYGNNGYAFYFILLERIYRTNNAEIEVSDAETIQILSRKVAVTTDEFMLMLHTALKWKCFDREQYEQRGVLTSNGIKKRTSVVVEKRVNMREKYKEKVSDAETREETQQKPDKVKERKEKKSKEKEIKVEEIYRTIQHLDLSLSDYTKLREKYSESEITDVLDEMENWAKLKTKTSAYLTANNWLKKREKEGQAKPKYAPNVEKALKLVEKYEKEEQNGGIW